MTIGSDSISGYLEQLAARKSTPGGGSVAALSAAEACGLIAMVANFSDGGQAEAIAREATEVMMTLLRLADEDSLAFKQVMQAYQGEADLQSALIAAATVPTHVLESSQTMQPHARYLLEHGNKNLVTDVGIAALLIHAAIKSCELNILINAKAMSAQNASEFTAALASANANLSAWSDIADQSKTVLQS